MYVYSFDTESSMWKNECFFWKYRSKDPFFHKLNLICFFERKEIFVKLMVQKIFASGLFALYFILVKKTRIISRLQFLFSVIFTKQWRWTNRKLRFSLFLNETLLYYTKLKLFFFLKLDFQCIFFCCTIRLLKFSFSIFGFMTKIIKTTKTFFLP